MSEYSLIGIFFSAPVGFSTNPGDCLFLPVPCEVKYLDAERSGCKFFFYRNAKKNQGSNCILMSKFCTFLVDMLSSAKSNESRSAPLISDMDHLEIAITKLQEMLERISKYVDSVVVSFCIEVLKDKGILNVNFDGLIGW